jgi:hypothetical protein
MLEWLLAKRKREGELPLYAGLRSTPSRGLPHELAAVVAAEQLYRAVSILRHEPYHRE